MDLVELLRELKGINTSFDYGVELVVMAVKQNLNLNNLELELSELFEMDKVCKKGFLLAKQTLKKEMI